MITSFALIFIVGLSMAAVCNKIKIPRIIGMLITGIILGPFVLNLFDPTILGISAELRKMALIIILIKAGLSLNISDLKQIGRPAILMSFLPAIFEIIGFLIFGPVFLPVTRLEAAIMGAVLAAVSPAVVVPRMVELMEKKYGTNKKIPQLILAGASLDDVFVIVLFSTFVSMAQGDGISIRSFIDVPVSIISGILLGALLGFCLAYFFDLCYQKGQKVRNSTKVILILGFAFFLMTIEGWLEPWIAISGLLAIMSMACIIQMKSVPEVSKRLSQKYGKLWIAAEVILFVLVGAAVDIRYTLEAGIGAIITIFISLGFRSVGVLLCLIGTNLNKKERFYCIIAYLPKATVQAAIGSVPLSLGLPCGNLVLSIAVLSILITAPLGAILMDISYQKLLLHEN